MRPQTVRVLSGAKAIARQGLRIVAALLILACSDVALEPAPITSVSEAKAKWQALALASYRVDVRQECFCSPVDQKWYEITVANNAVIGMRPLEPIDPQISRRPDFPTISRVFQLLEEWPASAWNPARAGPARAEFEPLTGLPQRVWLGYPSADDSGVYYEFRNLRAGTSQQ